jgi:hypothetical protein
MILTVVVVSLCTPMRRQNRAVPTTLAVEKPHQSLLKRCIDTLFSLNRFLEVITFHKCSHNNININAYITIEGLLRSLV